MILHTFEAKSTREALRKAREELGPSACILEVVRKGGSMRVVAAVERPTSRASVPEVSELRGDAARRYGTLVDALVARGFTNAAASRLAAGAVVGTISPEADSGSSGGTLEASFARWLRPATPLESSLRECVAIVGPPGAGKTSLVSKRAARLAGTGPGRLILASMDLERLGGAEQLESVARALDAEFALVRRKEDLLSLLARAAGGRHLLIDTPGVSWRDLAAMHDLKSRLSPLRHGEIELLLPADLDAETLGELARSFQALSPARVSVGRSDLTARPGVVISLLMSLGLPVESISSGPRIPDDLLCDVLAALSRLAFLEKSGTGAGARLPEALTPLPHAAGRTTNPAKEIHQ